MRAGSVKGRNVLRRPVKNNQTKQENSARQFRDGDKQMYHQTIEQNRCQVVENSTKLEGIAHKLFGKGIKKKTFRDKADCIASVSGSATDGRGKMLW